MELIVSTPFAALALRAALQMRCKVGTLIVRFWPQLTLICNELLGHGMGCRST